MPDTYPSVFEKLFKRKILKMKFRDFLNLPNTYFVKPIGNSKLFHAKIVKDRWDIAYLKEILNDDDSIYVCEVVKFINEYRLFIANFNLFEMIETSHFILDDKKIISNISPNNFIDDILKINPYNFIIIDIGQMSDGKWCIVEINPPFSISSYGLNIERYFQYCNDVWNHLSVMS